MKKIHSYYGCAPMPLGRGRMLLDPKSSAELTEPMDEAEFQRRVLGGVAACTKKYEEMDAKTKKAMEDLTAVKKACNDFAGGLAAIKRLEANLKREVDAAGWNPIRRIAEDEEKRSLFQAIIRSSVNAPVLGKDAEALKRALGESSTPGSTLINDDLAQDIYDTLAMYGKWNTLGARPVRTKTTKFPVKTSRAQAVAILDDAGEIPDDENKAGTSVSCNMVLVASLLNVQMALLEDAESDLTTDILTDFVEAYNERVDHFAFNADGTADATHGGMTGLFQSGTAAVAANGNTTVGELELDDFVRCLTTVAPAVLARRPKWWIHPSMLARVLLVRDENGRPIFQTAIEAPSFGAIGSILGYPVELVQAAPSTNAAGGAVAAFGDPNGYVVGNRVDFKFEASDHHKWNTHQRSFRGIGRAGTKIRRADAFAILKLAAM